MITKTEAMTARVFHYGECRAKVGPRGGVTISREEWRRNGQTQTWKTRPEEFRVPVKYGYSGTGQIRETDADSFHTEENCVLLITGNIDKAPNWLLEEQRAQSERVKTQTRDIYDKLRDLVNLTKTPRGEIL